MALQLVPIDHAEVQRYLPMRATIFECEDLTARAAVQDDRFTGEAARQGFSGLQFIAPGDRIPVIRMRAHAAQIDGVGRRAGCSASPASTYGPTSQAPPAEDSLEGASRIKSTTGSLRLKVTGKLNYRDDRRGVRSVRYRTVRPAKWARCVRRWYVRVQTHRSTHITRGERRRSRKSSTWKPGAAEHHYLARARW